MVEAPTPPLDPAGRGRRRRRRRRRRRARSSRPAPRATLRRCSATDDYPSSAQAAGAEGTAQAQLTIGPDGRVMGCNLDPLDRQRRRSIRRPATSFAAAPSSRRRATATATRPPIPITRRQLRGGWPKNSNQPLDSFKKGKHSYASSSSSRPAPSANPYGLIPALKQGGIIAISVFAILVLMSVFSFYILFTKLMQQQKIIARAARFAPASGTRPTCARRRPSSRRAAPIARSSTTRSSPRTSTAS